ncbi:hypothetical protein IPJ91_03715 [bacterium]|nr:MAG: hypothetical protein IPJ91_03715 [bacterium]
MKVTIKVFLTIIVAIFFINSTVYALPDSYNFEINGDKFDEISGIILPNANQIAIVSTSWNPNVRTGIPECNGLTEGGGLCGNGDIYLTIIDIASQRQVSQILLADDNAEGILNQEYASIIYNSLKDEYLVAWQELPANTSRFNYNGYEGSFEVGYDIYAQRIKIQNGQVSKLGSKSLVSNAQDSQWVPQIAYNKDNNEYLLTWHDHRNRGAIGVDPQKDIYAQILGFDPQGQLYRKGSNFVITKEGTSNAKYYQEYSGLIYDESTKHYIVLWHDSRTTKTNTNTTAEIWGQILDKDANFIGTNVPVVRTNEGIRSSAFVKLHNIPNSANYFISWDQVDEVQNRSIGFAVLDPELKIITIEDGIKKSAISLTGSSVISNSSCNANYCEVLWREGSFIQSVIKHLSTTSYVEGINVDFGTHVNNTLSLSTSNLTVSMFVGSGALNFYVTSDIPSIPEPPIVSKCTKYDLNNDDKVTIMGDFTKFLLEFSNPAVNSVADFSNPKDGKVDIVDFVMFRNALYQYAVTKSCDVSVLETEFRP